MYHGSLCSLLLVKKVEVQATLHKYQQAFVLMISESFPSPLATVLEGRARGGVRGSEKRTRLCIPWDSVLIFTGNDSSCLNSARSTSPESEVLARASSQFVFCFRRKQRVPGFEAGLHKNRTQLPTQQSTGGRTQ